LTISEVEKKLSKRIKKLLDEEDDELSKKSYKYLKKLEFYLVGGEEFFKDVIKSLEKSSKKTKDEETKNDIVKNESDEENPKDDKRKEKKKNS